MAKNMKVDVAVIGAGTAGLFARHYAAKAGAKTIMLDPGPLGTTCARVGCMPSKLLIAAAEAAHGARQAAVYGVKTRVSVDGAAVLRKVRSGRDPFRPSQHEAAFEGRVAGRNAARYPRVEAERRYCQLAIAFTDPQLAVVGKARGELAPGTFCCGELEYKDQGRARIMNAGRGRLKVYGGKRTGRLLGAEIAGPRAEHAAHLLAWCIEKNMTVSEMLRLPVYHPVLEEGLREALEDLSAKLRGRAPCACEEKVSGV